MGKARHKKIQDDDKLYSLLLHYVRLVVRLSYSRVLHVGAENIPRDGAVIFAPNHANTLMDAMVVLCYNHRPKVFVARADIFKHPTLAKIFTFLKIMPIMRQRDGYKAVKQNQETIDKAVDVLRDNIPFCIFPEGTHQAKHSLLPLSKGIFKIAFQAHEQMPETPLYIVPVGLTYGDFFRFRSSVRMEFGCPINVGQFMSEHLEQTPQEQMNSMKELLTERLQSAIFYLPNDEDYDATLEICAASEPFVAEQILKKNNKGMHALGVKLQANNVTLKRLEELKNSDPEKAKEVLVLGNEASMLRKRKGIDIASVSVKKPLLSRMPRAVFALLTLPYSLPASLLAAPIIFICEYICTKIKDPAFANSIKFVVNLAVWPLFVLLYAIMAFLFLPWQWAILVSLLTMPAPYIAHELWKTVRLAISDVKLLRDKSLKKILSQIRERMAEG